MALGFFTGKLFLFVMRKKIKLSREIFMIELLAGKETSIPKELSQQSFPESFRFYDPILNMIKSLIPAENLEVFAMKKGIDYKKQQESLSKKVKFKLGIEIN